MLIVQRVIRIDEVKVPYLSFKLPRQINYAVIAERLLLANLPRADDCAHLCMARVKHHLEVRMIDRFWHLNNITRLVEHKARLKLPEHEDTVVFRNLRAAFPNGDNPIPRCLPVYAWNLFFCIGDGIDADGRRTEVQGEL